MHIVIVGGGKVGNTLVEQLSKEGHDIVLIDTNSKVVNKNINTFDCIGFVGNGATYDIQVEAGVEETDLLIAATSSDEINILCCMVAKKIGAKRTIARVRSTDYVRQLGFLRDQLGINMLVNPELESAIEITRMLSFPAAIKVDTFAKGKVDLVEVKIREGGPMDGLSLKEISTRFKMKVLVCAIQRGERVIIPDGNDILMAGDKVHFTASHSVLTQFLKDSGHYTSKVRNVMIIGGGRIANYLARMLREIHIDVKIIEIDEKVCHQLSNDLPKATIIHGDGTDQELLHEEGILTTDALVVLTGIDEENIILSIYANSKKVDKIITKVNRSTFMDILSTVGVDSIISPKMISANQIVQYVRAMNNSQGSNSVMTLYKLVNDQVEALEFVVSQKTHYTSTPMKKIKFKDNILIGCIIRGNKTIFPTGDDTIEVNDRVIVISTTKFLNDLDEIVEEREA